MAEVLTQQVVNQWVSLVQGSFTFQEACFDIGISEPENRQKLRVYLYRLEQRDVVINLGNGRYRKKDNEKVKINWQDADSTNILNLVFPFGIEEYALLYPKNVVIVAGNKQAGKTTYLYNFIRNNMYDFNIELFNSETGVEQMKDRFTELEIPLDAPFDVYERYDNFADVIDPDKISVIDYLDMNSEYYLAGEEIDRIFRKLKNGVAIIGMQLPPPSKTLYKGQEKKVYRDYAYGGGQTAKRAFIYLTLFGDHKLKLVHAKKPAQPKINPENMMWSYTMNNNGQFANIQRFYPDDEVL